MGLSGNILNIAYILLCFRVERVREAFMGVKERKVILSSLKEKDKKVIWVSRVFLGHLERAATLEEMDLLASLDNQVHL